MARFRYTAMSLEGRSIAGETVAPDAAAVAADFSQRGLMLVSLDKMKSGGGGLFEQRPNPRAVTSFLGELALMLRSGLPLDEALDLAAKDLPSHLARVVAGIRQDILGGASFVQALERHPQVFPKDIVAMTRVADATGDLDGVFEAVAAEREQYHRMSEKITGALRYPAFLIVSAVGVLVFFLLNVIPQFSNLFADSGSDPGLLVHIVLAMSDGLIAHETEFAVGLAGLLLAALLAARMPATRRALSAAVLRLPIVGGIARLWRTSRFLSTLAVLLRQGVPLPEALKVLEGAVGPSGQVALASVGDTVRRGGRLHEALGAVNLIPSVAIRMVRIGEETGELARVARDAGALYARQLEKRLDNVSGLIGPVAIVVIAGLIGGLMVTIMSALVSVDQAVQ